MKLVNNILYIAFSELVELGVKGKTIRTGYERGSKSWQSIKDPSDLRKVLIAYEPLGKRYKALLFEKYGDVYRHVERQNLQLAWQKVRTALTATDTSMVRQYLRSKRKPDGSQLYPDAYMHRAANTAAWFMFLNTINGRRAARKYGFESKDALLQACINYWHETQEPLVIKTSNLRVLKRHLTAYKNTGTESLCGARHGNQNALKIGKQQAVCLLQLMCIHTKLVATQIHRFYNEKAVVKDWEQLSLSTVKNFVTMPEKAMLAFMNRHGLKQFRQQYELTMHRKKATLPHRMWVMDGSPMELFYNDGSRLPKRMYAFVVVDAHSWACVGVAYGKTETQALVFEAIRHAGRRTGVLAEQLQFDNSSAIKAHDMMEWYKDTFKYAFPAKVGNAKAKMVEPWLKQINEQVLRLYANYAGAGITAKRLDNKVNDEWVAKNIDKLPSKAQVIAQLNEAIFEQWNNRIMPAYGKSPNELLAATPNPQAKKMDFADIISVFWKYRMQGNNKRSYVYNREGITLQIGKEKHRYEVLDKNDKPDYNFWRKNAGKSFQLKYDPEDLTMVALYYEDTHVAIAQTAYKAPMAIADYGAGDGEKIQGRMAARKDFEKQLKQEAEALQIVDGGMEGVLLQVSDNYDAESYLKVPVLVGGSQKDLLNEAKAKTKVKGLYKKPATFEIIQPDNGN